MGIIKREHVRLSAADVESPRSLSRERQHQSKSARLVRLEGRVVGVEFTCSCGQTSLVELEFDGDETAANQDA